MFMLLWAEPQGETEGVFSSGDDGGCSKSMCEFKGGEAGSENGSGLPPILPDFLVAVDIGSRMVKLSERIAEAGFDSWALVTGGVCCVTAGPDRLDRPPSKQLFHHFKNIYPELERITTITNSMLLNCIIFRNKSNYINS